MSNIYRSLSPSSFYDYFIIDAYNIFIRYFYGIPPELRRQNKNYAVIYCLKKIISLQQKYTSKGIIWVFERGALLHKSYNKNYKKDRAKIYAQHKSPQFTSQLNRLREYIYLLPFVYYFISVGDEGDIVIAEMVKRFIEHNKNIKLGIISNDNDFWQLLVYPQVSLFYKNRIINHQNYERYIKIFKYVPPISYPLYKAIKGDKVDNIKGVYGIGDKTLERLFYNAWFENKILKNDNDLVNFLNFTPSIPLKTKQKLLNNLNIIKHNLPLVNLIDIQLLSLSGVVAIKNFIKNILNNKDIFYNFNKLYKLLTDDNILYMMPTITREIERYATLFKR